MTTETSNSPEGVTRAADSSSPAGSHPRQISVLIIEDISDVGLSESLPLQDQGFEVAVATNHEEAVEFAVRQEPDAIVLDLGPRDLDGIGVIRVLRSVPMTREIPFIILTEQDLGSVERVVRGWQVVRHVLKKPVNTDELARIIGALSDADSVR